MLIVSSTGKDVEQTKLSCCAYSGVNWYRHLWTLFGSMHWSLTHANLRSGNSILRFMHSRNTYMLHQGTYTWIPISALFIITPNRKLSKYPSTVEWESKLQYIYIIDYHPAMRVGIIYIYIYVYFINIMLSKRCQMQKSINEAKCLICVCFSSF